MLGKHGTGGVEHERPARIGQGLLSLLALLQLQGRLSAIRVAGQRSDVMQEDTMLAMIANLWLALIRLNVAMYFEHCSNH
ncbi:MAG: hypothetical protein IPK05_13265 [Comamonadaceae bacterium]|nr:hypothetical protein [Comamonadaceae bacterium]